MSHQKSTNVRAILLSIALVGLIVPNGIFIFCALRAPHRIGEVLLEPMAAVFVAEAFSLTLFFAWLLGTRRPGRLGFVALSLAGGLLFSVPLTLYLHASNPSSS